MSSMRPAAARLSVAAALAVYVGVSLLFSWPLPLQRTTHLPGDPNGDAGVYVWNLWVFRHELVDRGHSPFFTEAIFVPTKEKVWLALHNYTVADDVAAVPLVPWLGVVATFNTLHWASYALNALMMFLLARRLTRDTLAAFIAGLAFGFCPFLVTRGLGHASLVGAGAIPAFLLLLLKAREGGRRRDAMLAGGALVWAFFSDAYYGVFGGLILACVLLPALFDVSYVGVSPRTRTARRALDVVLGLLGAVVLWMLTTGGGEGTVLGQKVAARSLYTPMLALTLLALVRCALERGLRVGLQREVSWGTGARLLAWGAAPVLVLSLPFAQAFVAGLLAGRYVQPEIMWRSSPPGMDLLAFVLPNPNHPWLCLDLVRDWIQTRPNAYIENVASQSLVALALILWAARRRAALPRYWCGFTLFFLLLSLGPFIHLAGHNTCIPTPWTLLRYVPLVSNARSPGRIAVVATMGVSILFAFALSVWLRERRQRLLAAIAVAAAVFLELLPTPRPTWSASVPAVYRRIAADPRDVSVLELPLGVRSGASNVGDFTAYSQLCQTVHGKDLFGGYLSRTEDDWEEMYWDDPVTNALLRLSSKQALLPDAFDTARAERKRFLRDSRLGYVVVDTSRASVKLQRFAANALRLVQIDSDGRFDLYVPEGSPADNRE
jgi:hypothetical protein